MKHYCKKLIFVLSILLLPAFALANESVVGVNVSQQDSAALFALGQLYIDKDGNHYRYMQADGAVVAYEPMSYIANTWQIDAQIDLGVTPADSESVPVCYTSIAVTDDYYAWCFTGPGVFTSKVGGNVAADAIVYGHATAGYIDDAATACLLRGVTAPAAITASAGETGTFYAASEIYAVDLP